MCRIPIDYHELESIYGHMLNQSSRVVGFTSSREGEGVTSIVKSLAERLVCDGQRVLVVDLNCENPSLSRSLDVSTGNKVVPGDNIDVLPFARFQTDQKQFMQLKNTSWLQACFNDHRETYDWIIVDTSAVMHTSRRNVPAELVLSCCEATYILVKAGFTFRTELLDAVNRLRHRGVNLVGTIYNDQNNPTLAQELERESKRLEIKFPKIALWLKQRIRQSYALNIII